MGKILSQSEIEAVLSSLDFSSTGTTSSSVNATSEPAASMNLYDFEHPLPLQKSQLDTLRLASASASQKIQTGLNRLLRTPVVVNFLAVEQSTYRDCLAACENPACLAQFKPEGSSSRWLLDVSRSLAFAFVDCLLGGTVSGLALDRPFTDVEVRLIDKAVKTILRELSSDVLRTGALEMTDLSCDASLVVESTSNEAVVLVSFEILCPPCQGLVQLCIPWKEALPTAELNIFSEKGGAQRLRQSAAKVPVVVTARLARLKLAAHDFAQLKPGDVLLTDTSSSAEISLEVDGREIFRGTPGQCRNQKVFLVSSPPLGGKN
jgi:flagellar motor switch protein FliM